MVNALAKWSREVERIRTETREMMAICFQQVVSQLGEAEARRCWAEVAKRKGRKCGKPKGTTNPSRDAAILAHYDYWVRRHPDNKSRRGAPRFVGNYLAAIFPGQYGASACAIEKKLRRRLRLRKPERPGTWNALAVIARTGKFPVGDPPWDTDK